MEVGVPEPVMRADRTQQSQPVRIFQERHQLAGKAPGPCQPVRGHQARKPSVVTAARDPDRAPGLGGTRDALSEPASPPVVRITKHGG
jgi:hypothetical protein